MKSAWGLGLLILVSCGTVWAETGKAVIRGTAEGSAIAGTATFTDTPGGLQVAVQVTNILPGKHGFHIHQYGSCDDVGKAAGGHYNPDGVKHGFLPTDGFAGAHAGDLGNLEVGTDGSGKAELTLPGLRLSGGKYTVGGRAVVLHEQVDDFSQPTGNAGGRIGCGVIAITGA